VGGVNSSAVAVSRRVSSFIFILLSGRFAAWEKRKFDGRRTH
jgi:hypothetical protein